MLMVRWQLPGKFPKVKIFVSNKGIDNIFGVGVEA